VSILLEVHPGEVIPPVNFLRLPENIGHIALDGAVSGPTFVLPSEMKASYNHHEGSRRLSTGSAAMQLLMGIRMAELESFEGSDGDLNTIIHVNDCDQDVGIAVALARRYRSLRYGPPDSELDNFVDLVGKLDITNGAYPTDFNSSLMRGQAWVFLPYTGFVESGGLRRQDSSEFEAVINDIGERFDAHLRGQGEEHIINPDFTPIGGGNVSNWTMFTEAVSHEGRIGAFRSGIRAYVIPRQLDETSWQYTIGRTSDGIHAFDVSALYQHLNRVEACNEADCWGGSDLIGGSPRVGGSKLSPVQLEREINAHLQGLCDCTSANRSGRGYRI
jgi:hypothetical protein